MNLRVTMTPRPITQHEIAIIRTTVANGATVQVDPIVFERLGDRMALRHEDDQKTTRGRQRP